MVDRKFHVLVVYQAIVPSTYIRIVNPFDRLAQNGRMEYQGQPLDVVASHHLQWADIVVFHRVDHPKGLELLEEVRILKKASIYETSDNWVEPPPSYHPAYRYHRKIVVRNVVERFLRNVDLVVVSTNKLRTSFLQFNDNVYVVPNCVDFRWAVRRKNLTGRIRIGYAGTKTHGGDFEVVLPALERILECREDDVTLVFLGYVPESMQGRPQVEEWLFEPNYNSYLHRLGSLGLDIGIAPLADNDFNKHKSNIKYLEYSASGAAGIYSRCLPYAESVRHGVTGLLVDHTSEDWFEALDLLISNETLRRRIQSRALEDVRTRYDLSRCCNAWCCALVEAFRSGSRPKKERPIKQNETPFHKIVFIGSGLLGTHDRVEEGVVEALSLLGLNVVYLPLLAGPFVANTVGAVGASDIRDRDLMASRAIRPDDLLERIKQAKADVILTLEAYAIPRDVLAEISKIDTVSCVLFPTRWRKGNPYFSSRLDAHIGTFFSHVCVDDPSLADIHRTLGNPNVHPIPIPSPSVGDETSVRSSFRDTWERTAKAILKILKASKGLCEPRYYNQTVFLHESEASRDWGGKAQVFAFEDPQRQIGEDASHALNGLLLHASFPYTIVHFAKGKLIEKLASRALDQFRTRLDLGAVVFCNREGSILSCVLSNRVVWRSTWARSGFKTLFCALQDLLFRMESRGYTVIYETADEEGSAGLIHQGLEESHQDKELLSREWGKEPRNRIEAKRLVNISHNLRDSGEVEAALSVLEAAASLDPDYFLPYREMGAFLLALGRTKEAEDHLRRARELDDSDVRASLLYAIYLEEVGEHSTALPILKSLLGREITVQQRTTTLRYMGRCYEGLGQVDKAMKYLHQAIDLEPSYRGALQDIFGLYVRMEEWRGALTVAERLMACFPSDPEIFNDTGVILYRLSRKWEALEFFRKALTVDESHQEALVNFQSVADELGVVQERVQGRAVG